MLSHIRSTGNCFLLVGLLLGAAGAVSAQRPSFRSTIDLVLLNVTVTDSGGRYVGDLAADDFDVFEEGRLQELAFFSSAIAPLSASLVIDTSSSMEEQMPLAKQAAMDFVARLRPSDLAEIVSFDSRVEVLQPLTDDRSLLESAIQRLRAGGSTSLYNAVYIVLRQLAKIRPQGADDIRRQVIVVLSDGEDTASLVTFDQVLDLVKQSQTVIYSVGLGLAASSPNKRSEAEFGLRQLAQETGGRLFTPKRPQELAGVYGQVASELTSQYVLGYLSNNQPQHATWRRVSVRVRRPQMQARTRAGYYTTNEQ
jgi:Ca-activated chloride channel homolog